MKNKIFNLIILLFCSLCFSQQEITWQDLSKVNYTDKFFPAYDDYFMYPEFLPSIKKLEGKLITIKGYFLNIDPETNLYILSKSQMSSCFFCGQAGPETAVELEFINKPKFKTDTVVEITGILKLNKEDVDHFNYILTGCKGKIIK